MTDGTGLLAGKRGLVMGVANDKSIAWGAAHACAKQGASLAFTFQGEALEKRVRPLAESVGSSTLLPCDVTTEGETAATVAKAAEALGGLDFLIHAIAFSDKNELKGRYVDTSRANFLRTMDISCFSFTEAAKAAADVMPAEGGAMVTMTYYGAERVMPHYNVMGVAKAALEASVRYIAMDLGGRNIRCNAISAGPIKTLAASGIGDFRHILRWNEANAPLRRNVTTDEVGGASVYLVSSLSSGVTGEVHHVDSGYHVVGMLNPDGAAAVAELAGDLAGK